MTIARPRAQILSIWRLILTICSAVPALLIAFFLHGTAYMIATVLWFTIYLTVSLLYLPALYNSLVYIIEDDIVTLRRGVIYNNIYRIPVYAIQFTTLTISPFSRIFGLVTFEVVAAGARISMPGMTLKEARTFDKIISSLKEENSHV